MNNFERLMNGLPLEQPTPKPITFADEYELARRVGDARFGSECKHEQVRGGRCVECLRKVVTP